MASDEHPIVARPWPGGEKRRGGPTPHHESSGAFLISSINSFILFLVASKSYSSLHNLPPFPTHALLTALPATFDELGSCRGNSAQSFFRILFFHDRLNGRSISEKVPYQNEKLLYNRKGLTHHLRSPSPRHLSFQNLSVDSPPPLSPCRLITLVCYELPILLLYDIADTIVCATETWEVPIPFRIILIVILMRQFFSFPNIT